MVLSGDADKSVLFFPFVFTPLDGGVVGLEFECLCFSLSTFSGVFGLEDGLFDLVNSFL